MGIQILVVEDNPDSATVLRDRLHAMGHEVMTVGDGQAALEALQQFTPGLIFLDIEMPKLNGIEMLERMSCDGTAFYLSWSRRAFDFGQVTDPFAEGGTG